MNPRNIIILLTIMTFSSHLNARTKLTTLPPRQDVRIDLSSKNQTLVEEDRTINLISGVNRVDFSWAGTHIYKDSIQIKAIQSPGISTILNINYPPGENALFWEIHSTQSGPAIFRITYLINGFQKKSSYIILSDPDEKNIELKHRLTFANHSGESYSQATIQMTPHSQHDNKESLNKQIWRMLAFKEQNIPLKKEYIYDHNYALRAPQKNHHAKFYYSFINEAENPLNQFGTDTLPSGKARVYLKTNQNKETFLGEDLLSNTAVKQKASIYLGLAKDITIKKTQIKNKREKIAKNCYHEHQTFRWHLQNYKKENITLTIRQPMSGHWELHEVTLMKEIGERNEKKETQLDLRDYGKVEIKHNGLLEFTINLPPSGSEQIKWNLYAKWTLKNRGF